MFGSQRIDFHKKSEKAFDFFELVDNIYSGLEYNSKDNSIKRINNLLYKSTLLAPYNSNITSLFNFLDIFTFGFYDPNQAYFTGYNSTDNRKFRFWVLADWISAVIWENKHFWRSNFTRTYIPELSKYNDAPNETQCLPEFPKRPDPRLGCRFPTFEKFPSQFGPGDFTEFILNITQLDVWQFWNFKAQLEMVPQLILTPLLGPIVDANPNLKAILTLIDPFFKIINNATGLQGAEALPKFMLQINLPRFPFMLIVLIIIIWIIIEQIYVFVFVVIDVIALIPVANPTTISGVDVTSMRNTPFQTQMLTVAMAFLFKKELKKNDVKEKELKKNDVKKTVVKGK
jgi:hypothetical protein